MKIKAAVISEKGGLFQIKELDLDPPKRNEVLVRIVACGVCHTDEVVRNQIIPVPLPAVLGHEGCGVVVETGSDVTTFKKGDHVGFSYAYCGACEICREGKPYMCVDGVKLNFDGAYPDGTKRHSDDGSYVSVFFGQSAFASHAVLDVNNLIPIPDSVDLKLVGPLGCGIQTGAGAVLNYLRPTLADSILVTGCGTVGLSAVMAARIAGCRTIIACDVVDSRIELAKELGATHTINSINTGSVLDEVVKITGRGSTYAIDCTGNAGCVRQSLKCTRPLGTCVVLGVTGDMTINIQEELMGPGKKLIGIVEGFSVPQVFIPKLLDYYKKGLFPFDRLISFYKFNDIGKAFDDTHSGKVVKAVITMD